MPSLTLKAILAATDLTEGSDAILRAAAALAGATGAELHLLHAFDLDDAPYAGPKRGVGFPERVAEAERMLEEQLRRAAPAAPPAEGRVEIRTAYKAILEGAEAVEADLIVLGPHRKRALGDRLLGSTADRVIRSSRAPCLVVRGEVRFPLRKVLVPLDLSGHSREALEVALRWGLALGEPGAGGVPRAAVEVVHVVPSIFSRESGLFDEPTVGPELDREIQAVLPRIEGASELEVREEVVWSDLAADGILEEAAKRAPDLIVMATHGYGAVRRALIGSVASAVTRGAACSVLLVPPRPGTVEG